MFPGRGDVVRESHLSLLLIETGRGPGDGLGDELTEGDRRAAVDRDGDPERRVARAGPAETFDDVGARTGRHLDVTGDVVGGADAAEVAREPRRDL
uniref:Uncharacterized protein n=1 Tax=uncultured marine virus TaxID=186617 RepID=A0A0F7L9V1_9VIRU|nr:hypothetical protein [uncultured marine virus]